jgi:molybdate transport system regulatory protein
LTPLGLALISRYRAIEKAAATAASAQLAALNAELPAEGRARRNKRK